MVKFRYYVPQLKNNSETGEYEIWVGPVKTDKTYSDKFTGEYGLSSFKSTSEYNAYNKDANYIKLKERLQNEFSPTQLKLIEEFISFEENYKNPDNFIFNE